MEPGKPRYLIIIPGPTRNVTLYFDSVLIQECQKTQVFASLDKSKARIYGRRHRAQTVCDMLKEWMKRDDLYVTET